MLTHRAWVMYIGVSKLYQVIKRVVADVWSSRHVKIMLRQIWIAISQSLNDEINPNNAVCKMVASSNVRMWCVYRLTEYIISVTLYVNRYGKQLKASCFHFDYFHVVLQCASIFSRYNWVGFNLHPAILRSVHVLFLNTKNICALSYR